jgi:hypothetical protein
MVQCFGRHASLSPFSYPAILLIISRSLYIYKIPKKLIKQRYKIYRIADHGYIYNWIWSSREKGLQDIVLYLALTNIGCFVRNFALSLPRRYITIYLDNYFIFVPLFSELRACNFGAVGTTRLYKEFPQNLSDIKNRFATKLE